MGAVFRVYAREPCLLPFITTTGVSPDKYNKNAAHKKGRYEPVTENNVNLYERLGYGYSYSVFRATGSVVCESATKEGSCHR